VHIKDTSEIISPSASPNSPTPPTKTSGPTSSKERKQYADLLCKKPNRWSKADHADEEPTFYFVAELASCSDVGMILLTLNQEDQPTSTRKVAANGQLKKSVSRITKSSGYAPGSDPSATQQRQQFGKPDRPRGGSFHTNDKDNVIAFRRWTMNKNNGEAVVITNMSANREYDYPIGLLNPGPWRIRFDSSWSHYDLNAKAAGEGYVEAKAMSQPTTFPTMVTIALHSLCCQRTARSSSRKIPKPGFYRRCIRRLPL